MLTPVCSQKRKYRAVSVHTQGCITECDLGDITTWSATCLISVIIQSPLLWLQNPVFRFSQNKKTFAIWSENWSDWLLCFSHTGSLLPVPAFIWPCVTPCIVSSSASLDFWFLFLLLWESFDTFCGTEEQNKSSLIVAQIYTHGTLGENAKTSGPTEQQQQNKKKAGLCLCETSELSRRDEYRKEKA